MSGFEMLVIGAVIGLALLALLLAIILPVDA